jgi:drug/metabolite transporter (DMT)-like permease
MPAAPEAAARTSRLPGPVRGACWMTLGAFWLIVMALAIRALSPKYSVLELIFLRSVISLVLILPWAIRQGAARLRTTRPRLHLFRNVVHYVGNLGWFFGVATIPLADVAALQFTLPLFTVIMAAVFLRETVGPHRWLATVVGFAGALIVIRPGFATVGIGTLAVLGSAAFYAASQTASKALSRTESPQSVLFFMALVFVPLSAGPAALDWTTPEMADAPAILLLGVTGYLAHFSIIRAFAAADASFVMPFDFMKLPLSAAAGFVLYLEFPDVWTWVGAVIIFGATWYITWRETRRPKHG